MVPVDGAPAILKALPDVIVRDKFNVEFKTVAPLTFNDDRHVVAPFNFVVPLTFKLFKLV